VTGPETTGVSRAVEIAVEVSDLRVELTSTGEDIVDEISFTILQGQVLGLVGESGSGKTTVGLALLGHTRRGVRIPHGSVRVGDLDVLALSERKLRALRGGVISYVPQDPSAALNPNLRIGRQLDEVLETHGFGDTDAGRQARIVEMLEEVALPTGREFLRRYPHQLSGGQQQRIGLAMAFACRPRVIVLDEPTTGLDVTTQAHVLETVRLLCSAHGVAALYVSHDLAVVATLADRVAVMYAGRIVENGPERVLFRAAAHPYTRRLIEAIPEISGRHALEGIPGTAPRPGLRPEGCFFAPRCTYAIPSCSEELPPVEEVAPGHSVRCIRHAEVLALAAGERRDAQALPVPDSGSALVRVAGLDAWHGERQVLFGIEVAVQPRQCVALVGESGSGKTTLARCIAGLHSNFKGAVELQGRPLEPGARARGRGERQALQYIFQSPYNSLNPRKTIAQIVSQPLQLFFDLGRRQEHERLVATLERVRLGGSVLTRYPHELSGGERQRVAIARALAAEPALLVCDEVTSALDVSVQAAIVDLLAELQREMGLGLLFVTHNLALIRTIAEDVVVMNDGRIVEAGKVEDVLGAPQDAYTKSLLADTPSMELALAAGG
jgi:peptide/nickel transport system ATP-binding protein